ncbi:universal stress protein E [Pseudomonas sp. JUb42]|uniref:universal stress protein n=1 Tax=Pseudomonas sp. JUb42 TaxID=2940611 RepID=UPI002169515B|nr:universal stress protein [Pseudomonas sp. JUb42]MCS3471582.1 universal stress protein E [Pseudomonas sp. JUb42]
MSKVERLLLVASPLMERTPAFDRALALAKAQAAALHIVAFVYVEALATAGLVNDQALHEIKEGYLAGHREWLEQQAVAMRHSGVQVTQEVVWVRRPFDEIMEHIREMKPSLVIKDLERQSWLSRVMFTSLDERLLHDCPVSLHLVAQVTHAIPRKILAAVDPFRPEEQHDGLNDRIISTAEKLAQQCNADLHLLYAYDLSTVFGWESDMAFSSEAQAQIYDLDKEAFDHLADRFGVPADRKHLLMGNPAKVIEAFTRAHGVDVIVMGTVHRSAMSKWLGSTTEQVAHHLQSSLLTLNPRADMP